MSQVSENIGIAINTSDVRKKVQKQNETLNTAQEDLERAVMVRDEFHLIDDMLDISRIASGTLSINMARFDLCTLVQEVVERFCDQTVGATRYFTH